MNYRAIQVFESEDGKITIIQKTASWVGEPIKYQVKDWILETDYYVEAKSIDEAFEKAVDEHDAEEVRRTIIKFPRAEEKK